MGEARCASGGGNGASMRDCTSCLVRKGSAARRRKKRGDARWARSWRCTRHEHGARGFRAAPFEAGCHRSMLAGIHCFRLVGNLFLGKGRCVWAGRSRAYGSGTLGTVAVELSSICDRIASKAAKVRLWRGLGVWWDGIGLFLDGSLAAEFRKNPTLVRVSIDSSQNAAGHRSSGVSFIALDAGPSAAAALLR